MKPKHQRLIFVGFSVMSFCAAVLLVMQAFRENLVFFYAPSEVPMSLASTQMIRVGGLIEKDSIVRKPDDVILFRVTDGRKNLQVRFKGMPPSLFREEQGVVVEGRLNESGILDVERVLVKHDEKYMPKEVVEALKRSGRWQEDGKLE